MAHAHFGFIAALPDPRWDDEEALVRGLQQGDACATEYVVQQYAPALYRYAYYQLQDAALAEDLVADVLIRMVEHVDRFVPEGVPFEAWLFRIARNLVADHYRARQRRPSISLEQWLAAVPTAEPARLDAEIAGVPEREALQAGLAQLSEEQRQVVVLHVVVGWELPQVAQLLNRTLPSVKSLYYRGIRSLRRVMLRDARPESRN